VSFGALARLVRYAVQQRERNDGLEIAFMRTVSDTIGRLVLASLLIAVALTAQRRGGW